MLEPAIAVTIVTGFLGAGKTTLLQRWLSELPRDETAVIVNERGEAGIDGELLASHVARLRELTGGCVCCSGQAELASALIELSSATPRPRRILIETSGAASPAGVIRVVAAPRAAQSLVLDGVVTVLDASRAHDVLAFDLAVEQLGFADVVVLSHATEASAGASHLDPGTVEQLVARHAPAAVIARADHGRTDSSLLELLSQRTEHLHLAAEGSAHAVIDAVSLTLDGELDDERFADWIEGTLAGLEARILRIKGILAMHGVAQRVIVQGVSEAVDVQLGRLWGDAPRSSRLVVLGLGLDRAALEASFLQCAADARDA